MKQEEWRAVIGYENLYEVSSKGQVRRATTKRIKKQDIERYSRVSLWKNGIERHVRVHRLVAEAFLGSPGEGYEVNHKNGSKLDNDVENLEWVNHSDNIKHAFKTGLKNNSSIKRQVVRNDGKTFESIAEAAKHIGAKPCSVISVLSGRRKTIKGWSLSYTDDERGRL